MKYPAALSLYLFAALPGYAADQLSCTLDTLGNLGWQLEKQSDDIGFENTSSCDTFATPVFKYHRGRETPQRLLDRSRQTLKSLTSKCLFARNYRDAVRTAVDKLSANTDFEFLPSGNDPRDPFLPPEGTWDTTSERGYDIPLASISASVNALYTKPFVAECSTAVQIAQLGALSEHYGADTTDNMIRLNEVGIGTWKQFTKVPSIAAKQSLFINRNDRSEDGLLKLANIGRAAFYGQVGYIKPHKGVDSIDSMDNLGQNYLIVEITDKAVASIQARKKPLKELSRLSRKIWKKYRKKQISGGKMETLRKEIQQEFEAADPFFSEIEIYVHPLSTKNFASHMARQFSYNPRTPYVFEVYEDYQQGYFFNRYIEHQISECTAQ